MKHNYIKARCENCGASIAMEFKEGAEVPRARCQNCKKPIESYNITEDLME